MNVYIQKLFLAIEGKNKQDILACLENIKENFSDNNLIAEFISPPTITKIYNELEKLGVPRKAMMLNLKNKVMHRNKRAFYFIEAFKNGLKHI